MAGSLYIWIIAAVFLGAVLVIALFAVLLFAGHLLDKNRTGSKTGFLELPPELRSRPAPPSSSLAEDPPPPADTPRP
jgi:hypothetical protein